MRELDREDLCWLSRYGWGGECVKGLERVIEELTGGGARREAEGFAELGGVACDLGVTGAPGGGDVCDPVPAVQIAGGVDGHATGELKPLTLHALGAAFKARRPKRFTKWNTPFETVVRDWDLWTTPGS